MHCKAEGLATAIVPRGETPTHRLLSESELNLGCGRRLQRHQCLCRQSQKHGLLGLGMWGIFSAVVQGYCSVLGKGHVGKAMWGVGC